MTEKLAVKHTNSLALKNHKLLMKERDSKNSYSYSKLYRSAIFCAVTCCIFLIYWFILTPLLIGTLSAHNSHKSDHASVRLLVLYWFIAFLIWLFIMLCLFLSWKCMGTKREDNATSRSYGTNDSQQLTSLIDAKRQVSLFPKLINNKSDTIVSDESRENKNKKHKDLPPLVIHRRNSGNDIANVDENIDEVDENLDSEKSRNDDEKPDVKDYLKLVTVTPQDELETESAKGPLSPRELFFIDLIREAEKAERSGARNHQETEKKPFLPSDFASTKENDINEEKKSIEATFFIADVESPKSPMSVKSEVFLNIDPCPEPIKEWSVNLDEEKPGLSLDNASTDEANEDTEDIITVSEI
ncbi:uncharacterized protein LOC108626234 [Ceratina calcarata]|uniref:Uncharacterized protein LOC108626234 n=1 Tax=Ceratina calcarata TaxID=156304 RepID=A0AAJ7J271_9HYME|nr:uncharacterized protein LOC108626234 [Ceratina calcarata]